MRVTSLGHAGILVETAHGSIVCDPWFVPAFMGSWFPFPRNDQLSANLRERVESADYLYVSHLHGDHWDEPWLRHHLRRDIGVLLPGYPTRELDRSMTALGFTNLIRTVDREEIDLGGLVVAIHVETSITDGPGGDSALVVAADGARIVDQNDCRTTDLAALRSHGPVDLHWLQYSGAIWYPMVYDMPPEELASLTSAKVDSQLARAMRYVEAIGARAVVPSAGPPCFLDPALFALNDIGGTSPTIFCDQRTFLRRLADTDHAGILAVPGTTIEITGDGIDVVHPFPDSTVEAIFTEKADYLRRYQADWLPWLDELKSTWPHDVDHDLVGTLRAWWEPLLTMAPTVRAAIGAACLLRAGDADILIDFPAGEVRAHAGEPYRFRFEIDRPLVEQVVADRAVDWSNSLFLSCRFRAWRDGEFNEWIYNFFKSLSTERMRRTEAEAVRRLDPPTSTEPDIELDGWIVQRRCPHRNADLAVFGEIDGCTLTCTLHGWRFDLDTGRCLTSADHPISARRRT
ncbi:MAG: Rieske 2Fe-2S domain-containing protein [Ilumatobacteraceae bacterium]